VISEYGQRRCLEGRTPQARGRRFNAPIARALGCWGTDATPNVLAAGEISTLRASAASPPGLGSAARSTADAGLL